MNWKRIVAREFLLLVGVALVGVIAAGVLWVRNEMLRDSLDEMELSLNNLEEKGRGSMKPSASYSSSISRPDPLGILCDSVHTPKPDPLGILEKEEEGFNKWLPPGALASMRIFSHADSLDLRRKLLVDQINLMTGETLTGPEILDRSLFVSLWLAVVIYPMRLLFLGVVWSVRTLREDRGC